MLLQRIADTGLLNTAREWDTLRQRLNQMLTLGAPTTGGAFPPVNVWTSEESVIVSAEIPGIDPGKIELSLLNETLTIKGEKAAENLGPETSYLRQERGFGNFVRSLQLPFRVDSSRVEAKFSNGILHITLPRAEADKPRKINVQVSQ